MEEFMTIGAFAARTGLSISAVRFYASQQLLVPAQVDRGTGYRRYAEAQVSDGVLIRDLRRLEMPLSDIALALGRTEAERRELVEHHLRRLEEVVLRAHHVAQTMGVTTSTTENRMSASIHALDLAKALDQVLPAAGNDPERPHLMSVLVEGKDGSIRLVATDSHRLAIRDLVPSRLDGEFTAIVPAATLVRWRASITGQGELGLAVDDNGLELAGDELHLTARTVPVTFPDYERFLEPTDDVTSVRTDRQQLEAALEGFEDDSTIHISTSKTSVKLGQGHQTKEMGASCDGADQQVAVNSRFAADAVRHAVGTEVVIEIEDAVNPLLFRSADDGTFTSRVMPIKLD